MKRISILRKTVPTGMRLSLILTCIVLITACVTPLGPSQGEFMISVINTGNEEKINEIISTPFLVDDIVIISPGDVTSYIVELVNSIGELPIDSVVTTSLEKVIKPDNIELQTFLKAIYPPDHIVYRVSHNEGDIFLLVGKGENGIKLYGISGPVS